MIIKRVIVVLLVCIFSNSLFAQNTVFNEAFRVVPGLPAKSFSVQGALGGYLIYSVTADSTNHFDPSISKIDSVGNIVWQKSYHKAGYDFIPYGTVNETGVTVPWGGGRNSGLGK